MTTIWLGNHAAVHHLQHPDDPDTLVRTPLEGHRCTMVQPPEGLTRAELLHDLGHPQGIWQAHSDADGPAWVASTDHQLAAAIAAIYDCELRDPEPDPAAVPQPDLQPGSEA